MYSLYGLICLYVSKLSDGNNQATAASLNGEGELIGPIPATQSAEDKKKKKKDLINHSCLKLKLSAAGPLTFNMLIGELYSR